MYIYVLTLWFSLFRKTVLSIVIVYMYIEV